MDSLYQISEDLLAIFANIEENEGEVTEEELQALEIKQEELNEKLSSYKKAIRVWNADVDACKAEEKRLKDAKEQLAKAERLVNDMKDYYTDSVEKLAEARNEIEDILNEFYE